MAHSQQLLLSVEETARRLSCSRSLVYELMAASKFRSVRLGRKRLIDASSLAAFVASLPTSPLKVAEKGN